MEVRRTGLVDLSSETGSEELAFSSSLASEALLKEKTTSYYGKHLLVWARQQQQHGQEGEAQAHSAHTCTWLRYK